jgi:RNA polymerase sigma-70 factor (ECF subfamily)
MPRSGTDQRCELRGAMTTEFALRDNWLREKFERQTRPFIAVLHRTARRLAAQAVDAEDLVHDTYLKAFQAYRTVHLPDDASCRAWLFRIMININRDRYRRAARSPEVTTTECLEETLGGTLWCPEPGPDTRLEHKRFVQAADAAIASLPPEDQLVVVLFFVEELSYREIAEIAQCPIGTVMSRLWRARRFLREELRAYVEREPDNSLDESSAATRRLTR